MTIENVINCKKGKHTIKIGFVLSFTRPLTTVQLNVMNNISDKETNISQLPDIAHKWVCTCNYHICISIFK